MRGRERHAGREEEKIKQRQLTGNEPLPLVPLFRSVCDSADLPRFMSAAKAAVRHARSGEICEVKSGAGPRAEQQTSTECESRGADTDRS
eukprot:751973-Hanusia_phi.AAC.1